MNERIKELMLEAGFNELVNETPDEQLLHQPVFNADKFAELIVRECSTLAFDGPNGILEHFGFGVDQ